MISTKFKAVILAAGKGTRMQSNLPKVLHTVLGEPMVVRIVRLALSCGADEVGVVVGYEGNSVMRNIQEHFPDDPISFHEQTEMKGTADAVNSAQDLYKDHEGPVLILYGDVPNLPRELVQRVIQLWEEGSRPLVLVTGNVDGEHKYGRIIRDGQEVPRRIVEHSDADDEERRITEVNVGVYLVDAKFLMSGLGGTAASGETGEFYLTDLVEMAWEAGTPAGVIVSMDMKALHGVNTQKELAAAEAYALSVQDS